MNVDQNTNVRPDLNTLVELAAELAAKADLAMARLLRAEATGEPSETITDLRAASERAHGAMAGAHSDVFNCLCNAPAEGWPTKQQFFAASQTANQRAAELIGEALNRRSPRRASFHSARDAFFYGPQRGSEQAKQTLLDSIKVLEEGNA